MDDEQRQAHLLSFLARRGRGVDDLTAQVDRSFGEPRLVVATGSVLQGFGNEESDLDVVALVAAPRVTDIPIPSHLLGLPVDVNYLDVDWVRDAAAETVTGFTPAVLGLSPSRWRAAHRRMTKVGRLVYGLALAGDPGLLDVQRELRAAFPGYAAAWWRAECLRQLTAARLLSAGRPLLAAQRGYDAGMAALESAVSSLGEAYTGPKWIGAKLRRVGDPDLLEAYHRLVRVPVSGPDSAAYLAEVGRMVTRLRAVAPLPEDPHVAVAPHEGVERTVAHGRVLLHRHGARGVSSDDPGLGVVDERGLLFDGPVSAMPDPVRTLLTENLAWLTVRRVSA